MKTGLDFSKKETPTVTIDPTLNKYRDEILFPEKLEKANKMLKTAKLPKNRYKS